jgi:hypothetical protein
MASHIHSKRLVAHKSKLHQAKPRQTIKMIINITRVPAPKAWLAPDPARPRQSIRKSRKLPAPLNIPIFCIHPITLLRFPDTSRKPIIPCQIIPLEAQNTPRVIARSHKLLDRPPALRTASAASAIVHPQVDTAPP